MSYCHICTQCTCGEQLQSPVFEAKLLCDVLMIGSVVHGGFCFPSFRNVTFHYRRSSAAYFGGMCSVSRGVGVNEVRFIIKHRPNISVTMRIAVCVSDLWPLLLPQYGNSLAMAGSLSQSLAQNLGIQWDPASKRSTYCSYLKKSGHSGHFSSFQPVCFTSMQIVKISWGTWTLFFQVHPTAVGGAHQHQDSRVPAKAENRLFQTTHVSLFKRSLLFVLQFFLFFPALFFYDQYGPWSCWQFLYRSY